MNAGGWLIWKEEIKCRGQNIKDNEEDEGQLDDAVSYGH